MRATPGQAPARRACSTVRRTHRPQDSCGRSRAVDRALPSAGAGRRSHKGACKSMPSRWRGSCAVHSPRLSLGLSRPSTPQSAPIGRPVRVTATVGSPCLRHRFWCVRAPATGPMRLVAPVDTADPALQRPPDLREAVGPAHSTQQPGPWPFNCAPTRVPVAAFRAVQTSTAAGPRRRLGGRGQRGSGRTGSGRTPTASPPG